MGNNAIWTGPHSAIVGMEKMIDDEAVHLRVLRMGRYAKIR